VLVKTLLEEPVVDSVENDLIHVRQIVIFEHVGPTARTVAPRRQLGRLTSANTDLAERAEGVDLIRREALASPDEHFRDVNYAEYFEYLSGGLQRSRCFRECGSSIPPIRDDDR
jgi:hypothetical protein